MRRFKVVKVVQPGYENKPMFELYVRNSWSKRIAYLLGPWMYVSEYKSLTDAYLAMEPYKDHSYLKYTEYYNERGDLIPRYVDHCY